MGEATPLADQDRLRRELMELFSTASPGALKSALRLIQKPPRVMRITPKHPQLAEAAIALIRDGVGLRTAPYKVPEGAYQHKFAIAFLG